MSFNSTLGGNVKSPANKTIVVNGRFQGGGAATNMTKIASKGITSVNYNAATGKYIITFDNVGKNFLGCTFGVLTSAGTAAGQRVVNMVAYSATAKTLTITVADTATPTLADLAATDELHIQAVFSDSDVI